MAQDGEEDEPLKGAELGLAVRPAKQVGNGTAGAAAKANGTFTGYPDI